MKWDIIYTSLLTNLCNNYKHDHRRSAASNWNRWRWMSFHRSLCRELAMVTLEWLVLDIRIRMSQGCDCEPRCYGMQMNVVVFGWWMMAKWSTSGLSGYCDWPALPGWKLSSTALRIIDHDVYITPRWPGQTSRNLCKIYRWLCNAMETIVVWEDDNKIETRFEVVHKDPSPSRKDNAWITWWF